MVDTLPTKDEQRTNLETLTNEELEITATDIDIDHSQMSREEVIEAIIEATGSVEENKEEDQTVAASQDNNTGGETLPQFEGIQILEVLQDGREVRDAEGSVKQYHCSLANGTTAHVPAEEFADCMNLIPESLKAPKTPETGGEDE